MVVHPAQDWCGCVIHVLRWSKLWMKGVHFRPLWTLLVNLDCKYSSDHHFMHCLSCVKCSSANHDTVSRHMTQPKSSCSSWFNNFVCIWQDLLFRNGNDNLNNMQAISIESETRDECNLLVDGNDQMSLDKDPESSFIEYFPGAAQTYWGGSAFINKFHADEFSNHRALNIYYPFTSTGDWELGLWLLCSGLSMNAINSFLSLSLVHLFYLALSTVFCSQYHAKIKLLPLLFHMAKELHGQAELLPSDPHWKSQEICTFYLMKRPILLYWHDSFELMEALFNNPEFQDTMDFSPYQLYDSAACLYHVYAEWMSEDEAWSMQVYFCLYWWISFIDILSSCRYPQV